MILIAGVCLHLPGIQRPLLGNFAIYQTAQAMIARFFLEDHFTSVLYPRVNVLVNGEPSLLLLYYPVASLLAAGLKFILGGPLDVWGRIQAVLFFAASGAYLYGFVSKQGSPRLGILSLAAFCLCPLTLIYGQSFQNEMATVFFSLGFFYHFKSALEKSSNVHTGIAALMGSGILLTRPNNLFLLLPALFLALSAPRGKKIPAVLRLSFCAAAGLVLPALWYWHVWRVSVTHSNIYSTLFAQLMARSRFASPVVLNAGYYLGLLKVIADIVLTPPGFVFFLAGIFFAFARPARETMFFAVWSFAFLASSLLIPKKLIEHNFYWLHFLGGALPLCALGFEELSRKIAAPGLRKKTGFFFLAVVFLFSMRYSLHPAFKTSEADRFVIPIAAELQKLTQKNNSRIVVQGTHALLYYADRYGWPFTVIKTGTVSDYYTGMNWEKLPEEQWNRRNEAFKDPVTTLEYLRTAEGATHFIETNPAELKQNADFSTYLDSHFRRIANAENAWAIYDLKETP